MGRPVGEQCPDVRDRGVDDPSVVPREVGSIGVLGAGQMGAGIAWAHAAAGIKSAVVDVDQSRVDDALRRLRSVVLGVATGSLPMVLSPRWLPPGAIPRWMLPPELRPSAGVPPTAPPETPP